MKKIFIKLLEQPKIIIPSVFIVAIIIGAISYRFIGQAPVVTLSRDSNLATSTVKSTENSVDLAFSKSGRLGTVSVTVGNVTKKGDILASLDAGDAWGVVNQAKGALELAKAQYASMDVQYANAKKQQDVLVANAHRTLLSSNLVAIASKKDYENSTAVIDNNQIPQISGTYTCDKEGRYEIEPYQSMAVSGYSFTFTGLESGNGDVAHYTPQAFGVCGLFIQFPVGYSTNFVKWAIEIPNTKSPSYATNKNAYDLAVATRDGILKQLEANLGKNGSSDANVGQATINSAKGAYDATLAAYQNNLITAPMDGVITFVDSHLKVGQSVTANKVLITIIKK